MYKHKIDAFFEKERENMVNEICELIKIPSEVTERVGNLPYGIEASKVIDKFIELANNKGFFTKNMDYYVAYAAYGDGPRELDLLAHLDVVPAGDGWTVSKDGYTPCVKNGRIYGRGAADDKGPAIAALYAMYAIKSIGIPLSKEVRLVAGSDEESGSREDTKYYFDYEGVANYTISPDADYPIINIEKGSLRGKVVSNYHTGDILPRIISIDAGTKRYIIPGEAKAVVKGISKEIITQKAKEINDNTGVDITIEKINGDEISLLATGKWTHVGAPEQGNSALSGIIKFLCSLPIASCEGFEKLNIINSIFPHGDWLGVAAGIERSTENSGKLLSTFNIFHYSETGFEGSFDCKVPVGCTEENTKKVLVKKFEDKNIDIINCEQKPAHHVPMDSKLVQTLLKYYEQYSGLKGYGVAIDGNTYVHGINNAVAFGCAMPGINNNMHFANEFALIDDLIMSAKIYTNAIIDLCS